MDISKIDRKPLSDITRLAIATKEFPDREVKGKYFDQTQDATATDDKFVF